MQQPVPPTHLLYLHGFRSSPRSFKAQMLAGVITARQAQGLDLVWACPQLPPSPAQAWRDIQALTTDWPRDTMAVVGSSLGGFYATVAAERLGCRAYVINPAVAPARDLARYIGEQNTFDRPDDRFFFRPEFITELEALAPYPITRPDRYGGLVAEGDEVLHAPEMRAAYPGVGLTLIPGSDHAVSDFAEHLPGLLGWLGLGQGRDVA
jgi:predicted esterase YcpF (UPF0227 family)